MKVVEKKPRSPWVWFVAFATLIYLLIEFSFNAALLDVVGGDSTTTEVDDIEKAGRLISGFAVALLFWPMILYSARTAQMKILILLSATSVLMASVYLAEERLVHHLTNQTGPESRYVATHLQLIRQSLLQGVVKIEGLDLPRESFNTPDGKAFFATFPLMVYSTPNIIEKINGQLPSIIQNHFESKTGGLDAYFERYATSFQQVQRLYNEEYISGSMKYRKAIDSIPALQERTWLNLEKNLARHGRTPFTIERRYWADIRRKLRADGIPVPDSWEPSQYRQLTQIIEKSVRFTSKKAFDAGIVSMLGTPGTAMPAEMSFQSFIAHPAVQKKWIESSGYPQELKIKLGYFQKQEFEKKVYKPILEYQIKKRLAQLSSPTEYEAGGRYEQVGHDAMRALIVPALALTLSLIGAITHAFKLTLLVGHLSTGYTLRAWLKPPIILGGAAIMIATFNLNGSSEITKQPIYTYFETQTSAKMGSLLTSTIKGVIHGQVVAYPIFDLIPKIR